MKYDNMLLKHKKRTYPPRVVLTVIMKTTIPIALPVEFKGSLKNRDLDIKLALPLGMYITPAWNSGTFHGISRSSV